MIDYIMCIVSFFHRNMCWKCRSFLQLQLIPHKRGILHLENILFSFFSSHLTFCLAHTALCKNAASLLAIQQVLPYFFVRHYTQQQIPRFDSPRGLGGVQKFSPCCGGPLQVLPLPPTVVCEGEVNWWLQIRVWGWTDTDGQIDGWWMNGFCLFFTCKCLFNLLKHTTCHFKMYLFMGNTHAHRPALVSRYWSWPIG